MTQPARDLQSELLAAIVAGHQEASAADRSPDELAEVFARFVSDRLGR